ncbi:MAG: HTTM domain-containing protein [Myxococcota bacterium]
MNGRWARWVAFWNEREAPDALALLRITFGLALVANVLEQLIFGNVLEYYAEIGHGGIFTFAYNRNPYTLFRVVPLTAGWVYTLVCAQLVAAVCLTLGLYTRVASVLCLVLQMTFYDRMVMFRFDGDNVFRVCLYLMALAPAGAAWSLDARWRGKGQQDIPRWPRRLFMAQLAVIYTRTGVVKLGSSWSIMDGWSAVYLALNLPGIARWPGDWAAVIYPLTQLATFVVSWWEVLFFLLPINVYLRRDPSRGGRLRQLLARHDWRPLFLLIGVGMHLGITILMDIGLFGTVMMSLYVCYLHPHEARRVLELVAGLTRRPSSMGSGVERAPVVAP